MRAAGGFPIEFGTIAVCDGISMGHEGMRASLVSREVIADSVESVMHAERFDALVGLAGCDKSLPGMLMAAGRLDLPRSSSTAARSCPGAARRSRSTSCGCSRRSVPARRARSTTRSWSRSSATPARPRARVRACSPPTPWRRWPRRWAWRCRPAPRRRRSTAGATTSPTPAARPWWACSEQGIRPRQIMTKEAFENAIAVGDGARRLDQRRAPPARHRERGPGRAAARRLQPGRPASAAPRGHEAARASTT